MLSSSQPHVAVIGAGYWGKNLIRNFDNLGALAYVVDSDARALNSTASMYPKLCTTENIQTVLQDERVVGVVIATPANTHTELAIQAMKAGKCVWVEKPMTLLVEDAIRIIEVEKESSDVFVMVDHLLWYHQAIMILANIIDTNQLGKISYLYSHRLNLGVMRKNENVTWSFAPHDISLILGLLKECPTSVHSTGVAAVPNGVADTTLTSLSFDSGVHAHIFVSWTHPFKEHRLVVIGENGMLVFENNGKAKLTRYPMPTQWENGRPVSNKKEGIEINFENIEALSTACIEFLRCIREKRTPYTDSAEGLRVVRVLSDCEKSLKVYMSR